MIKGKVIFGAYISLFILYSFFASCQANAPEFKVASEELIQNKAEPQITLEKDQKDTIPYLFFWKEKYDLEQALINNIDPPNGYIRKASPKNSFAAWLNHLPLADDNTVYLFNGEKKYNQRAQFKVLDIDIGKKDLQQCADAVMRLRAEYLYSSNQYDKIHFKYTNGANIPFLKWSSGFYPGLKGNKVVWTSSANNKSYKSFKKYLTNIFMYAGTASLEKEMESIDISQIQAGDVFIKGGFPGHAVIVIDVAQNEQTGDKAFILAQSYMPAQNIHILKNPNNTEMSPWYNLKEIENSIVTPEWTFYSNQLKRFVE